MVLSFLKCVAKVALKGAANFATFGIAGELVEEIWNQWSRNADAEQRRQELEALARLNQKQARQEAAAAVAEAKTAEASVHQLPEIDLPLETYLSQVPAHIRRSLRRPTDPSGTTITPN